jgi:hypothetical protein
VECWFQSLTKDDDDIAVFSGAREKFIGGWCATGGCRHPAVKMVANTKAMMTAQQPASGTKMPGH